MAGNIQNAFKAVRPRNAQKFNLTNPGAPGNMPSGFNQGGVPGKYHQQGIQKTASGGFVVSGSTPVGSASYFYVTGPDLRVVSVTRIDSTFTHAGGIQVCGNILGIGVEKIDQPSGGSRVHFYDISNPAAPRQLPRHMLRSQETAGAVGLVQTPTGYVAVVAGWDSKRLTFHRFSSFSLPLGGIETVAVTVTTSDWKKYQNINLFLDNNQKLWLVGTHTNESLGREDWGDLYEVGIDWSRGTVTLNERESMHFYRNGEGPRFVYGAGYHWNGSGFEVYACEGQMPDNGVVRCNKWT